MNPYTYYNQAGQCFRLPDRPLEPPDCWGDKSEYQYDEEYDHAEDEMIGRTGLRPKY